MKLTKLSLLCVPLLASLSPVVAQTNPPAPAKQAALSQNRTPAVSVSTAFQKEIIESVTVTGTLVPRNEVMVGPEIEGLRIIEILVEEGDSVKKGDVLARLSREQLDALLAQSDAALARADAAIAQSQSQIAQIEANVTFTTTDLERTRTLVQQSVASQAQLDQKLNLATTAKSQLQAAKDATRVVQADKANLEAQRRELLVRIARTEVKAPADGLISRRSAKLGAMVNQTTRLGRLRIGLSAKADNWIGSFARGQIEIRLSQSILVPSSAVLYPNGKASVQTVADNRIVERPVELGITTGSFIEIRSGLADQTRVVTRAGAFLRDGDLITPVIEGEKR
ncbi:MAG: biotin/lipoyl-binding protein [Alphaproteobacteria bacterium]|nr:biotin/lipoyl-binding protein [Alphaproteobacteria bacterium]